MHADVHGAASVILKNHRRFPPPGAAASAPAAAAAAAASASSAPAPRSRPPLPALSLAQAGACAVCRSSAWSSKVVARAWWVEAGQVSKQPPTGEFLTQVSFFFLSFFEIFLVLSFSFPGLEGGRPRSVAAAAAAAAAGAAAAAAASISPGSLLPAQAPPPLPSPPSSPAPPAPTGTPRPRQAPARPDGKKNKNPTH